MAREAPESLDVLLSRGEDLVGHRFADRSLLEQALTHPSFADEAGVRADYERLEFLGDAVLGLVVVEEVFRRHPDLPEGVMTKMKIAVVAGSTLSEVAASLHLDDLLRFGLSERGTGRRGMDSALENAFEALVGALYLDAGLEVARRFVLESLGDRIEPDIVEGIEHPKSRLQEIVQASGDAPAYAIVSAQGPPHERTFVAEVSVGGKVLARGSGASKKEAEMNAASEALSRVIEG
jgi:ribonuclease-3